MNLCCTPRRKKVVHIYRGRRLLRTRWGQGDLFLFIIRGMVQIEKLTPFSEQRKRFPHGSQAFHPRKRGCGCRRLKINSTTQQFRLSLVCSFSSVIEITVNARYDRHDTRQCVPRFKSAQDKSVRDCRAVKSACPAYAKSDIFPTTKKSNVY